MKHHNYTSRTHATPRTHLMFYSLLDALAFVFGVMLGGLALGRMMAWYFFG